MKNPSYKHQRLVGALIDFFKEKFGYEILRAMYSGYNEPQKHGRHEPDIVARDKKGVIHLAEAKVGDDILSEESREQFIDFSNRITIDTHEPVFFHIIVYKKDEPTLMSVLNQIGLGQKIGNIIKIWTLNL